MQKTKLARLERINQFGSRNFVYALGVLAAATRINFDIKTTYPEARKYEPLDTMEIVNNDVVDIQINLNAMTDEDRYIIPAGSTRIIRDTPIWNVYITNLNAGIATVANMVILTLYRSPLNADTILRSQV